jgi:disulfide oxidoreductase YuzD
MEIPLMHLNMTDYYKSLNLREMCTHIEAILEADLSYPIILDEDGEILDGRHRVMKALIDREKTIKAVRFLENPSPCRVDD